MPNGGTLQVSCDNFTADAERRSPLIATSRRAITFAIAIRDEGVGIPEDLLKRIFDPYFTTKPKGNGLGLATTYSIIKNHNGLITRRIRRCIVVPPSPFTCPPLAASEVPRRTATPAQPKSIHGTGRILIVDDEEAIRALVEFTLEPARL